MKFTSASFITFISHNVLTLGFAVIVYSAQAQTTPDSGQAGQIPKVNCDNITFPGKTGGDQIIYKGSVPQPLFELATPSGGTGDIQYLWMEYLQIGSLPAQWYPILSATSASYQPGPLHSTKKFMRCAARAGCNTWIESNTVTITVTETSF